MKYRILIVDDDLPSMKAVASGIRLFYEAQDPPVDHEIKSASTIIAALRIIDAEPFDLAIIDQRLNTAAEGLVVLDAFLQKDRTAIAMILTAYPDDVCMTKALCAGARDYIRKIGDPPDHGTDGDLGIVLDYSYVVARKTLHALQFRTLDLFFREDVRVTRADVDLARRWQV
jgi:CheY-like chemotaxis protein